MVGNVPYGPTLKVRFPFDDAGPGTTTLSDTSGGGVNVTLQMINQSGGSTNLHGAANSGVAGLTNPNRALNLSANPNQGASGGASGSFAAITNSALGFGNVNSLVVTMWLKQLYLLPANFGPRMFILGNSTNSDCGTANSIGMKFQDAADLYFFVNTVQATAAFGSNLPTNNWIFVAMAYDHTNVTIYEGTDLTSATLISTTAAAGQTVPLGSAASLFLGNRLDRARCFAGWIDDFRFYTGAGDLSFVESVRQSASGPSGLTAAPGNNQVSLSWNPLLGASSYNIKRSTTSGGPYSTHFDIRCSKQEQTTLIQRQSPWDDLLLCGFSRDFQNQRGSRNGQLPGGSQCDRPWHLNFSVHVYIQTSGNGIIINWPSGTLQSATNGLLRPVERSDGCASHVTLWRHAC